MLARSPWLGKVLPDDYLQPCTDAAASETPMPVMAESALNSALCCSLGPIFVFPFTDGSAECASLDRWRKGFDVQGLAHVQCLYSYHGDSSRWLD